MSDIFIGEIRMFGGNFAPANWALCNGQLMSIEENTTLYSLLGTTYGGDGQTTFALPDLQGRLPMHFGQGQGLQPRVLGEMAGNETVTVMLNEMPGHSHPVVASTDTGSLQGPDATAVPGTPASTAGTPQLYVIPGTSTVTPVAMSTAAIGLDGGSQSHPNLMPSLCVSFIIALQGLYPSRN